MLDYQGLALLPEISHRDLALCHGNGAGFSEVLAQKQVAISGIEVQSP
jgi:hypothetical protein